MATLTENRKINTEKNFNEVLIFFEIRQFMIKKQ